jgi:ATP-dependent Clp endopeptidase proteolytic subunit ClpP
MIDKLKDLIGIKEDEGQKGDQKRAQQMAELEKEIAQALLMEMPPQRKEPDLRSIGLFADVSEERIAELIHAMLYLNEVNKVNKTKTPITFYLSTYGGSADDMFGMYDIMRQVREETEIHTIGLGKVMSAGVILLASGTKGKRKIGKNCRVMIHSVIAGNHGPLHNLINEMEAVEQIQQMYIDCLVAETKLTKKQLKKLLERKVNVYLSAEEAVEYGIADIII